MGCSESEKVKPLSLAPDTLLVVDIQRRRGGQLLLTCAFADETTICDIPIFRCQLGYTHVVKRITDQQSVRVLIRPSPGTSIEAGQTIWFSQHSLPRFPARSGRVLFVCHEGGAVLLRQMLKGVDTSRIKCIQHAHSRDAFFCDAIPNSIKISGEEELAASMNEELGGFDYVMAVGPLWLLQTTKMLAGYYTRPAFGFHCVCCGQIAEDKPEEKWFELETYAADTIINNQENEPDLFEAAYCNSELHRRCIKAIEQAQASQQTLDGNASLTVSARALDELLHSIPKDSQAAPDFLNTLQKELENVRLDTRPPVKPSSPKTAGVSRGDSGVALPASRFPAPKKQSRNVSVVEQPLPAGPSADGAAEKRSIMVVSPEMILAPDLPLQQPIEEPESIMPIIETAPGNASVREQEKEPIGDAVPRKRAKSSKRGVSAKQQVLMSSLITREETKELQALEAAGIDELSSIGDDLSDEMIDI